ncbi:unnamed protein product [Sphenostylis stenocarpa]|uniref:Uncharacterized protein n=1 Tax=Sphenostylis stenocarpa TaxID=92480 RepID=A0AA86SPJ8_9FABA|nr:unnamed protein product [Sphenostylis stenocarpa]
MGELESLDARRLMMVLSVETRREGGLMRCYHAYRNGCGRESHDSRCMASSPEMGAFPLVAWYLSRKVYD